MTAPAPPWGTRRELIDAIGAALDAGAGFAMGKIGFSEQHWLYLPIFLAAGPDPMRRRAFEMTVAFHCDRQSGVWPADPASMQAFAAFHARFVAALDWIGLFGVAMERAIIDHYAIAARPVHFQALEPDRSIPDDPAQCWLPHLAGRRVLILAPFAHLLRERATAPIFEGVWAKTGKRWFHPAVVDSIEFPYGHDPAARRRFASATLLFDHVMAEVQRRSFDVALIGAGGLGIPLAAAIKAMGRVGLSLGGHLQVLFGINGRRWRDRPDWARDYVTAQWIDLPARYHPPDKHRLMDNGAYW